MTIDKYVLEALSLSRSEGPIYRQLADHFGQLVQQGVLKPGDKLPTHRALADELQVTVGTVTRSYAEMEKRGLVEARVGAGTFVKQSERQGWFLQPVRTENHECNLGYNIPPALDRSATIQEALQQLATSREQLGHMMLYQKAEGFDQHRQCVADWLKQRGVAVDASRMLFTSGAQHGVQLALTVMCRAGDTLLVEKYAYPGVISLAQQQQVKLEPVEMDDQGLLPQSLEAACKRHNPRAIYCTPTLQNPTTAIMNSERRVQILAVCRKYGVMVLEDDVNGLLPTNPPPPLVNSDPDNVIYIGSLSKCLAPGLRVGFLSAPKRLYRRLAIALQNQSWMISPVLTGLSCELLRSGAADQILQWVQADMRLRYQILQQVLGSFDIRSQPNCFHSWLRIPDEWQLNKFIRACHQQAVTVKSGELFVPPGCKAPQYIRLAISGPESVPQLEQGLEKIRDLIS
ncbi:aminotransferase-like domain-containing protein [Spongorhabdus nitratireducens]